jgi:membrane-associated phospholipid phosphatase
MNNNFFSNLIKSYKKYLADKKFIWSLIFGFLLLVFSLEINFLVASYATEKQSNSVTDIILSNIPNYDVAGIFVYGLLALLAFIIFVTLLKPQQIPFVTKSTAVFLLIRSVFVGVTHIGVYPNTISISTNFAVLESLTSGADLFFSGHTGLPFLMALIFWGNKKLRYTFLFLSVFFGAIALLGHYHYTIDVLAAFFITFGIYRICLKVFKKDHDIFLSGI